MSSTTPSLFLYWLEYSGSIETSKVYIKVKVIFSFHWFWHHKGVRCQTFILYFDNNVLFVLPPMSIGVPIAYGHLMDGWSRCATNTLGAPLQTPISITNLGCHCSAMLVQVISMPQWILWLHASQCGSTKQYWMGQDDSYPICQCWCCTGEIKIGV